MRTPVITMPALGLALSGALFSALALGQSTSPRNLQAPTTQELLTACARKPAAERLKCEEGVRTNQDAGDGKRNKSVSQQQAEQPQTQNRVKTDPGSSSTPMQPSQQDARGSRTRSDRTRMSQRSDQIKTTPQAPSGSDPNISTDAASTRIGDETRQRTGPSSDASSDRSQSNTERATTERARRQPSDEAASKKADPSNERNTTEAPTQDRAQSRPNDNPNKEPGSP